MNHSKLLMKWVKHITLYLFVLSTLPAALAQRSNCGASPIENTLTQPDGSQITLYALGNEAIHYLETKEGFTVLENAKGFFEYATTDQNGNLVNSGITARNGQSFKNGVPHLRYSKEQANMLLQVFKHKHAHAYETDALGKTDIPSMPFPSKGTRKLLVLLVEYPDLRATFTKTNFEMLLNQPNYNGTGSFRDYYLAASRNQLDIQSDVYGWLMADSSYRYYGFARQNTDMARTQLVKGALQDAKDSFGLDFSIYDSDSNGFVDGLMIIYAGVPGSSPIPNRGDFMWPLRSVLPGGEQPTYNGVKVADYAISSEGIYYNGWFYMASIGVICHEFGHLLDLPDLYDVSGISQGVGEYSLMGKGGYLNYERTPCYPDAWSRVQLGWISEVVLDPADSLPGIAFPASNVMFVPRINTSRNNEYYLLEYRKREGFDSYLPSEGLAIWQINTDRAALLNFVDTLFGGVNGDVARPGVKLIQADGQWDLEYNRNTGDRYDLYPIIDYTTNTYYNNVFTPVSNPSSMLNHKVNGINQSSGVYITDIRYFRLFGIDNFITFNYDTVPLQVPGSSSSPAAGLTENEAEQMRLDTYPNPFANNMSVDFYLNKPASATIELFNLLGGKITEIQAGNLASGNQSIALNTEGLSNGIYLIKVNTGDKQGWAKVIKK